MSLARTSTSLCFVLFFAGCMAGEQPADPASMMASPTDGGVQTGEADAGTTMMMVRDGATLFAVYCASCHGADGLGTALAPVIANPVAGFAGLVVRTGRNEMGFPDPMPVFTTADLSDSDLTLVLEYLSKVSKPTEGNELYLRFCGNCHGPEAVGGRIDESIAGEKSDEIFEMVREGHHSREFADEEYMPAWNEADLTDVEVEAIANFLGALPGGEDDDDDDDDDDGD